MGVKLPGHAEKPGVNTFTGTRGAGDQIVQEWREFARHGQRSNLSCKRRGRVTVFGWLEPWGFAPHAPQVEIRAQHFAGPIRSFGAPCLVVRRTGSFGGFILRPVLSNGSGFDGLDVLDSVPQPPSIESNRPQVFHSLDGVRAALPPRCQLLPSQQNPNPPLGAWVERHVLSFELFAGKASGALVGLGSFTTARRF